LTETETETETEPQRDTQRGRVAERNRGTTAEARDAMTNEPNQRTERGARAMRRQHTHTIEGPLTAIRGS
jgi:hypothetical protein